MAGRTEDSGLFILAEACKAFGGGVMPEVMMGVDDHSI